MNHMQTNTKSNTTAFFPRISQLTTTAVVVATLRSIALVTVVGLIGLSVTGEAQLTPEWIKRVPVGTSLSSGTAGIQVDQDGVSYITGTSGSSSNTDITTVSFAPDGSTRWTQTWGSPGSGADIASGITKGSNGVLYVVGSTPGANFFANLLMLAYDAATGQKLQARLTLTDTSHSGEQVTITVDGNPTPVTINGNKAQLSINNPAPGEHTIELTDPAGCFPPRIPSCD